MQKLHPSLGYGLGLRKEHYADIIETRPAVDWFEILTENYLVPGGKPLYFLDTINEHYPMVMHGVSMSIGSSDPLNFEYLEKVKMLAKRVNARWISDHLCWTGIDQTNMHDLLPLPYTEEAIKHVASRIRIVQDYLEQPLLIENVSSYLSYKSSQMSEAAFYSQVVEEADCLMLLDVNNIFVSGFNHNFDPLDYLKAMPVHRVQQIHLAGHLNMGDYILDTHDHDVIDSVWGLYKEALKRFGPVSTMIERDDHIPPLNELLQELEHAKQIAHELFHKESSYENA